MFVMGPVLFYVVMLLNCANRRSESSDIVNPFVLFCLFVVMVGIFT